MSKGMCLCSICRYDGTPWCATCIKAGCNAIGDGRCHGEALPGFTDGVVAIALSDDMRSDLVVRANHAARTSRRSASAPVLTAISSPARVAEWLQWCDPNGCHVDPDDGFDPYTETTAWEALASMLEDNEPIDAQIRNRHRDSAGQPSSESLIDEAVGAVLAQVEDLDHGQAREALLRALAQYAPSHATATDIKVAIPRVLLSDNVAMAAAVIRTFDRTPAERDALARSLGWVSADACRAESQAVLDAAAERDATAQACGYADAADVAEQHLCVEHDCCEACGGEADELQQSLTMTGIGPTNRCRWICDECFAAIADDEAAAKAADEKRGAT